MAISEKMSAFAERLRATLDAVNVELAAKGAAEAGDYSELPAAVRSIQTGVTLPTQEKSVSPAESAQEVVPDDGYTLSKVTVAGAPLEAGSATPAASAKTYYPASGKYGFSQFKVGAIPSSYVQPSYTKAGGTYTLNPGENLSYNAKTYLTGALSVTAAASGGTETSLYGYVDVANNDAANWLDINFITNSDYDVSDMPKAIAIVKTTNCDSGVLAAFCLRSGESWGSALLLYGESSAVSVDNMVAWIGGDGDPYLSVGTDGLGQFKGGRYHVIAYYE